MGDRSTFESQVSPLLDSLYRTALRMTKNSDDAEDLVQETCLKAYRYFDRFEEGSNLRAWMFKILTNLFINRYRKKTKEPTAVEYDEGGDFYLYNQMVESGAVSENVGPEKDLFDRMLGADVQEAIDELPEDFRIVVVMAFIEGLSYEEIAEALDVPMGTVKSRLHRGRKMLQKSLFHYARKAGVIPPSS
ncbi:MAG: sigma-70 family RNA polymerase sigma factor [candidate division Zixibacteria bacterium]|nr:sigma-70 family RNA polymerase sigma factor [candidate division Zixibacteria bacterium]